MLESGDGFTGNSITVCKREKGNALTRRHCRATSWDTLKRKLCLSLALWSRDFPQKPQSLKKAHLLLLCGGGTKEQFAFGK